jgi:hypothetical protein
LPNTLISDGVKLLKVDAKSRPGGHAVSVACLVLIPIIIGLRHDDWLYSPIGYIDPWYNVGYFLNYFDPTFLNGYYKEDRVSWLVPGYFLYKTLGPLASNFVLHIGGLVLSAFFLYLTLARKILKRDAFVLALNDLGNSILSHRYLP